MKTKPYPQSEEKPMVAGEPTVTYQRTAPTTYRQDVLPHEPVEDTPLREGRCWLQLLQL